MTFNVKNLPFIVLISQNLVDWSRFHSMLRMLHLYLKKISRLNGECTRDIQSQKNDITAQKL